MNIQTIQNLIEHISAGIPGFPISYIVSHDKKNNNGRIYVQCCYNAPCTVSGEVREWHGRKWYLSEHMTEDEVVKTCFAAFKATVEHEVMEGFTFDGVRVFNPHINFRSLLEVSGNEVFRS